MAVSLLFVMIFDKIFGDFSIWSIWLDIGSPSSFSADDGHFRFLFHQNFFMLDIRVVKRDIKPALMRIADISDREYKNKVRY